MFSLSRLSFEPLMVFIFDAFKFPSYKLMSSFLDVPSQPLPKIIFLVAKHAQGQRFRLNDYFFDTMMIDDLEPILSFI